MGWAACLGESMLQLPRVGWKLLAWKNGASPDCIIVVVNVAVAVFVVVSELTRHECTSTARHDKLIGKIRVPGHLGV